MFDYVVCMVDKSNDNDRKAEKNKEKYICKKAGSTGLIKQKCYIFSYFSALCKGYTANTVGASCAFTGSRDAYCSRRAQDRA